MPQTFTKRDIRVGLNQIEAARKSLNNLRKLEPMPEVDRALQEAGTLLETAEMWAAKAIAQTPIEE